MVKGYYDKPLQELRDAVAICSESVPKIIVYFMKEADTFSSGIPKEVRDEIETLAYKFRNRCSCTRKD